MKRPLSIAIYSGIIPSTTFIEQLIHTVAKNHQVHLFGTLKHSAQYKKPNIKVIQTPISQWKNIGLTFFRCIKLLFKNPKMLALALKEANSYNGYYIKWMRFSRFVPVLLYQPDIFHLQWANEINRWMFLKKAYPCKIVVSCLGTLINISPKSNPKLKQRYLEHFKDVDAFQTVSDALAKDLKEFQVPEEKIHTIRSIVPELAFTYFNSPNESFKGSINLVSVGRYHWVKGYEYALEAIKQLKKHSNVSYTIIAPGHPPKSLLTLVKDLGLDNTITFVESMEQPKLFKTLKTFDMMLLPSLSEGVANVALEAMAVGLPVISTDCGGMPELISHGQNGWLVPVKNSKAMADRVVVVSQMDKGQRAIVIENAHKHVKQNYSEYKIGKDLEDFYKKVYDS
ncbi:glycosyltransferase family 4 protein [Winogradskyella sp. A3E31]|uniref:glycosyltransferase family 4 protein n=1 Tax=Winogradskyella sp. A3E31 TaxID=3349637 RepID=UPI00398B3811